MSRTDSLYHELRKYKNWFNIARLITLLLVFIPFIIGYRYRQVIWLVVSILLLVIMMTFIGIPILKKIRNLKKEIALIEEGEL